MRIAVATVGYAPDDPRCWSGTPSCITASLDSLSVKYDAIGPVSPWLHLGGRAVSAATRRTGHRVSWQVEPRLLRAMTGRLAASLPKSTDAIVTLGWLPYGDVTASIPTYYWGDSTFAQRIDTAPMWSGLSARTKRLVKPIEGEALRHLAGVVMPSAWAANDAIERYRVPVERVHVIPFGSNLPDPGPIPHHALPRSARMLTVGVEWHRKGIDRAVRIADLLRERGHEVSLDVVGVVPPDRSWHRTYVTYHGALHREVPGDMSRLRALYAASDLFLFPTRNDPAPIVLAEAASYSLPTVATAVGGVPERIDDGRSGVLMGPDQDDHEWAGAVAVILSDEAAYQRMCAQSRQLFEERFSWKAAVRTLLDVVRADTS